jgi:RNA polymerase sigma-70 factor (ECF subfamily)
MERHNRRLYRIALSILRNGSEAEEVVQEAYINAFTHLSGFPAIPVFRPGFPASP